MRVTLIRHGKTQGNLEHRYIGATDEPLVSGYHSVEPPYISDDAGIYSSPMKRCLETCDLLFPDREPVVVDDLREMDFGVFERRSGDEMADDPEYTEWVNGGCRDRCPGGEHPSDFYVRTCSAFEEIVRSDDRDKYIVTHGGVITAVMSRFFAHEDHIVFSRGWMIPNLTAIEVEVDYTNSNINILNYKKVLFEDGK